MPAPIKPNVGPAHAMAAIKAKQRRICAAAEFLRAEGWTVIEPEGNPK